MPRKSKASGRGFMDDAFSGNDVAHFFGAKESSKPIMDQKFTLNQGIDTARNITGL